MSAPWTAQEYEAKIATLTTLLQLRTEALSRVVAEREVLAGRLAKVEALADEWEATLSVAQWRRQAARRVRAALVGGQDDGRQS